MKFKTIKEIVIFSDLDEEATEKLQNSYPFWIELPLPEIEENE